MKPLSPSEISTYELCPRKWAWKYVAKLPTPPNRYAEFGIAFHKHNELWLRERKIPEGYASEASLAVIPLLPPPQTAGLRIEEHFEFEAVGHTWHGYKDLEHNAHIYDYKSTSDLCWAKTPEQLEQDPQATQYAWDTMLRDGVDAVAVTWLYVTRDKRPKRLPVHHVLRLDVIAPRLAQSAATADEIRLMRATVSEPLEVPYNATACDAFGGCPFKAKCGLSVTERMRSAMSQEAVKNDYLAKLRARKAAAQAATASTEPPPAEAKPQAINPPPVEGMPEVQPELPKPKRAKKAPAVESVHPGVEASPDVVVKVRVEDLKAFLRNAGIEVVS